MTESENVGCISCEEDCEFHAEEEEEGEDDEFECETPAFFDDEVIKPEDSITKPVDVLTIIELQKKKIRAVAEGCNISLGCAGQLLGFFKWDITRLYEKFFEEADTAKPNLSKLTGIIFSKVQYLKSDCSLECELCQKTFNSDELYALSCRHYGCKDCWKKYFHSNIVKGNTCLLLTCPFKECQITVNESLVQHLADEQDKELYEQYLLREFVAKGNPKVVSCPSTSCEQLHFVDHPAENVNCECECGEMFCFKCQLEAHRPCSCAELVNWKQKIQEHKPSRYGNSSQHYTLHTKKCPKCDLLMEKAGGCNHVVCRCRYHFCWLCLGSWDSHIPRGSGCLRYRDNYRTYADEHQNRKQLEEFLHYFGRYQAHKDSENMEGKVRQNAKIMMEKIKELHRLQSIEEVKYIMKGIDQLSECRRVLRYTYIQVYFLQEQRERNIYEFLQEDLEKETERLSFILEDPDLSKMNKENVVHVTRMAKKRLEHILSGAEEGFVCVRV